MGTRTTIVLALPAGSRLFGSPTLPQCASRPGCPAAGRPARYPADPRRRRRVRTRQAVPLIGVVNDRLERLQSIVPVLEHFRHRHLWLRVRMSGTLRPGRMRQVLKKQWGTPGCICGREPGLPCRIGEAAESHYRLNRALIQNGRNPAVAVGRNRSVSHMPATPALTVDAVEKSVDKNVAASNTQTLQETLRALARSADENTPRDHFVLRRVLANDEYAGTSNIQPAPMKNRTPFHPEISDGIDVFCGILQSHEQLLVIATIKSNRHGCPEVNCRRRMPMISSCPAAARSTCLTYVLVGWISAA